MKKFFKLIGLSLVIWSLTLIWPAINQALSPLTIGVLVGGLSTTLLAYFLGQYFGRSYGNGRVHDPLFHLRQTRPLSINAIRHHFSRQTSPMPIVIARNPASRPTRPMPMTR